MIEKKIGEKLKGFFGKKNAAPAEESSAPQEEEKQPDLSQQ